MSGPVSTNARLECPWRLASGSLAALLLSVVIASCGARSGVDTSADASVEPPLVPLPPAPATCVAAVESTDWTACLGLSSSPRLDPRRLQQIQCVNHQAIPACTEIVTEYWGCIAAAETVCQSRVRDDGYDTFFLGTEPCDSTGERMLDCLRECNGGYSCAEPDGVACTCSSDSPNAGEACVSYPNVDGSFPRCAPFCARCI